jgi:membrane protein YqaA with SNARE-associated domain
MKNVGLNHIPSVKGHVFNLTINLVFVAIFYTFLGAAVSWILSHMVPKFNEEWKNAPLWWQAADVAAEVSIIIVIAFWLTYFVNVWIPILHVSGALEHYVESFGGQMMFIYAVFVFMDILDDKLLVVFRKIFAQ